jgi:hypothetical protein
VFRDIVERADRWASREAVDRPDRRPGAVDPPFEVEVPDVDPELADEADAPADGTADADAHASDTGDAPNVEAETDFQFGHAVVSDDAPASGAPSTDRTDAKRASVAGGETDPATATEADRGTTESDKATETDPAGIGIESTRTGGVRSPEPADSPAEFTALDVDDASVAAETAFERDLATAVGDLARVLDRTTGVVANVARGLDRGDLLVPADGGGADESASHRVARAAVAQVAELLVIRHELTELEDAVAGLPRAGDSVTDPPENVRDALRAVADGTGAGGPVPVERVAELADDVDDVADRTNILAFNATIDAARDADGGERFALVADEAKSLAERSRSQIADVETFVSPVRPAGDDGEADGDDTGFADPTR